MSRTSSSATQRAFLALSCIGATLSPVTAAAQNATDTQERSGQAEEGRALGTVVVTDSAITDQDYKAQTLEGPKAIAPLLDTPRSVAVIPQQVIRDTASASLVEALRTVPGITFGAGEGGNPLGDRPFIRGFDSQASTFLDGVRDVGAQSREVFAIEQIEVVKGSNSVTGGRGTAGGSLNLVSKVPQPESFLNATGTVGEADYGRVTVDANLRASDLIGVRINGMWHNQDVAGRDALFQDRWGVSPSITIGVEGPTSLTALYYHLETNELPDSGIPLKYTPANRPANVTEVQPVTELNGREVDLDNFYGLVARDFRETTTDQLTLRAQHAFDGGITIRNTARWGRSSQDYIWTNPDDSAGNVVGTGTGPSQLPGGRVARSPKSRFGDTTIMVDQLDLFGTFATGALQHSFAGGLELSHEEAVRNSYAIASTPRCPTNSGANGSPPGVAPYNCTSLFDPNPFDPWAGSVARNPVSSGTITDVTTKAAYLFDQIGIGEKVQVNLGVRFDNFRTTVGVPGTPAATAPRLRLSREDNLWSVQAGLIFKPTPETSLYGSFATSNTPPGSFIGEGQDGNTFSATVSPDDLKVERTKSYEVGAKAEILDGGLLLNVALFQTDTQNARAVSDANTVAFIGERRVRGVELGFTGTILPGWQVFGGYSYLDARITDGGFTVTTVGTSSIAGPSVNTGKRFPNTPEHSFSITTNAELFDRLRVGGGAYYTGKVYGSYADTRTITNGQLVITNAFARSLPDYWRFDANAALRLTDQVEIGVNALNLTDKRYFTQIYTTHYGAIAPGRTILGVVNFRF